MDYDMDYHQFIKDLLYFADKVMAVRYNKRYDFWIVEVKSSHEQGFTKHLYGLCKSNFNKVVEQV